MKNLKKLQVLSKDYSVLYVEDNKSLRDNAENLLRKFFHIVHVAEDGEEALHIFLKHGFPIVITDIKMPNMDGITLTQKIKEIAPSTHVIVMSAFDDKEFLLKMIDLGVFKFLKKPVHLENLTDVLYSAMLDIKKESKLVETTSNVKSDAKQEVDLDNISLIFSIFELLKEKSQKVELHNYYKGLSITNDVEIVEVNKNTILLRVAFMQAKAMQYEEKTFVVSELLPYVVESSEVKIISFDNQLVELKHLKFIITSPTQRDTIRVYPTQGDSAHLYMKDIRIGGEIWIEDISLYSIRISLDYLQAGLRTCKYLSLELNLDSSSLVFTADVNILRIDEIKEKFYIVLSFSQEKNMKLMKYITKRQMETIREFKGMQYG